MIAKSIFAMAALASLAAVAVAQSGIRLKDAGYWQQTEHSEGTYSSYSLNAWFDVVTGELENGETVKKVLIEIQTLDENFTAIDSFGVYASQRQFDPVTRTYEWHAEVRLLNYYAWTVLPTEVTYTVTADLGEQLYGSRKYLYDEQNPHYLMKPMSAQNPVRYLPETLVLTFEDTVGPVASGAVRVWDPTPAALDKASVEVRYTVDGWQTVQSTLATRVPYGKEFSFKLDKLTKTANPLDLAEVLQFAVRFVNSQGLESWDNNYEHNYKQRLLPAILAPTVYDYPERQVYSGEIDVVFNVDMDKKFSTATVERIVSGGSAPEGASSSLSLFIDTSLVKNGDSAKYLVKAVAFGKVTVTKTFEFKVFNSLVKQTVSLPEEASGFWGLALSADNSSELILSAKGDRYSGRTFAVLNKESAAVVQTGKYGDGLAGQILVDAADSEKLYVFDSLVLSKVSKVDVSTADYKVDLKGLVFCGAGSVAFSSKYAFVLDTCGGILVVLDKQTGALKAKLTEADGLDLYSYDLVYDPASDSVYVFNGGSRVHLVSGTSLKIEKTWKGDVILREAALVGNGLFWIYGSVGNVEAVQLTEDLQIKSLANFTFASWSNRVPAGIVADPADGSAWVLDAGNNLLLKFSLASSAPLMVM